jgi:hypothetical protein
LFIRKTLASAAKFLAYNSRDKNLGKEVKIWENINQKTGISITWQELYPIYLACCFWGSQWTSKRIVFFCDNESIVQVLNKKTSKSPKIMDLLRPIVLCTLTNNFTFTAKHVRGIDNGIADSLCRFQMDRFKQLAPLASPLPCVIPSSMIQSKRPCLSTN